MTASALWAAARRKGEAMPTRSAPKASALTASMPVRMPPEAKTGTASPMALRTHCRLTAVGMPQSANARANRLQWASGARWYSTSLHEVPPAPATSMAATPASTSARATSPEMPQPTSLTMTGTSNARQTASILDRSPVQFQLPSGCRASCKGLR